jgi:radical SAM superfamily enzyme YgiQ (UPF0313 family)
MSKIKVLPVYPKFPLSFWSLDQALEISGKEALSPPLGLATVAAMLPEDQFEVQRIVDLNIEPLMDKYLENTDLVFVSSGLMQQKSHKDVIKRAHSKGKKVVIGGPYPTSYPDRNNEADYIIAGEAELTLQPFLEDLANGKPQRIYTPESVVGKETVSLTSEGKPNLNHTPIPRWDLLRLDQYSIAAVQYSRGCRFNCEFCDITQLFGRKPRGKDPDQMEGELEALYESGFRGEVFLVDDNILGNKNDLQKFLVRLKNWQKQRDHPFSFITQASVDLAWDSNNGILEDMVQAGVYKVFLGIESVEEEEIKLMRKGQNLKLSPLESVRRIQNAGINVAAGFILGTDGQKPDIFDKLYGFIQEAGIPFSMAGLLIALKNTDLHKRLDQEERLRPDNDHGGNTHAFSLNFEPRLAEGFSEKDLVRGYKDLLERLFDDKAYYERCRVLQREIGPGAYLMRGDSENRRSFFRFLKHQLVDRNLTLEAAKYLGKTLFTNPRYFPQAVGDAVKQQHFKQITRESIKVDDYESTLESWHRRFIEGVEATYLDYSGNLPKAKQIIEKKANQLVSRAERAYERLHEDLRDSALPVLDELREKVSIIGNSPYTKDL